MTDLEDALRSPDRKRQNQALKSLYTDPVINGKVWDWARQFNLTICEPDDILQEAIILLDEKLRKGEFEGRSRIRTYLLGICFNMIRDQKKKVNRIDLKDQFYEAEQMSEALQYDLVQLLEKTEEDEMVEAFLTKVLAKIDSKCRKALRNYYYEEMSMADIAIEQNYSSEQVAKTLLHRCRQRMRDLIQKDPIWSKQLKDLK